MRTRDDDKDILHHVYGEVAGGLIYVCVCVCVCVC